MKFKPGDKVRLRESFPFPQFAGKIVTITEIESENQLRAKYRDQNMVVWLNEVEPIVTIKAKYKKPVEQAPPRPGRLEVMQAAIDHNGIPYQMVKVNEELSELAKEICKYLIGKGDIDHIAEEMGDVYIVLGELQMMLNVPWCDIEAWQNRKLDRLWENLHEGD